MPTRTPYWSREYSANFTNNNNQTDWGQHSNQCSDTQGDDGMSPNTTPSQPDTVDSGNNAGFTIYVPQELELPPPDVIIPLIADSTALGLLFMATGDSDHSGDSTSADEKVTAPNADSRPDGVPSDWIHEPSDKGGGDKWINPDNPHDYVRSMPGNPDSTYPAQQEPYTVRMNNGKALDVNGNRVNPDTPEAHVPSGQFQFFP